LFTYNALDPGVGLSPRPRETSDQELLAATARVMQRLSPARLTLADVAKEAGVVPATLIQRFRTKRDLLLATCRWGAADLPARFAAARAKHKSPLQTLVAIYVECSTFVSTPEAMANGLAYLQIDLSDAAFRSVTSAQFNVLRSETKGLLDDAIAARELKKCATGELARLVHQVNTGAMLDWAVCRKGSLAEWIRSSLENLLLPYRRAGGIARKR
jgi:AcrR family transcriptional regulator